MLFAYLFIIGIPCFLIFFIIKKLLKVKSIQRDGIHTDATITHIRSLRINRGCMDLLTLEYKDRLGRYYPAKASVTAGKYRIGERMPVSYLPQKPTHYAFNNGNTYWGILIFCIILLLFALFASYEINKMAETMYYQNTR